MASSPTRTASRNSATAAAGGSILRLGLHGSCRLGSCPSPAPAQCRRSGPPHPIPATEKQRQQRASIASIAFSQGLLLSGRTLNTQRPTSRVSPTILAERCIASELPIAQRTGTFLAACEERRSLPGFRSNRVKAESGSGGGGSSSPARPRLPKCGSETIIASDSAVARTARKNQRSPARRSRRTAATSTDDQDRCSDRFLRRCLGPVR